jgi:divinyl protochlorophyllide a 8-vinyl-reductase
MDGGAVPFNRIGPNAVTQLAEALGPERAGSVFAAAGLSAHLREPPRTMVDEGDVIALHRALRDQFGEEGAARVSADAGRRTAHYLLAHRIPRALQWLLAILPAPTAARVLVTAIGRHAWTFAGSGRFRVLLGKPLRIEIAGGPIARAAPSAHPACAFYAAAFETLFRALVSPTTQVEETACEAMGAPACSFVLRWSQPAGAKHATGRMARR